MANKHKIFEFSVPYIYFICPNISNSSSSKKTGVKILVCIFKSFEVKYLDGIVVSIHDHIWVAIISHIYFHKNEGQSKGRMEDLPERSREQKMTQYFCKRWTYEMYVGTTSLGIKLPEADLEATYSKLQEENGSNKK